MQPRWSSAISLAALAGVALSACAPSAGDPAAVTAPTSRPLEDEVIYFVLPDRFENGDIANDSGGLSGDRLSTGFDPENNGFYHGGDLKGLTAQLDYLQTLGITAIWVSPIFRNKPVQGPPGLESAGYHGYWITDFEDVDPHFGTREDFRTLVDAAHGRGMKVYMDIITNHTADVIQMHECHGPDAPAELRNSGTCPYRSRGDYPYTMRGGLGGEPLNQGFMGDSPPFQTAENFARLTSPDYAYTTYIDPAEEHLKNPDWLNDPRLYHNRGDSFWHGESALYGDFSGLDDLMTENPRVVQGMIDIYRQWITDFRVDGFRIDTAKHVNPEFWQAFTPAILDHARSLGIDHFHVFGEAYEFSPAHLARFTKVDGLPSVLDFGFQGATRDFLLGKQATGENLARFFEADIAYAGGEATARTLPTFLGNHDMGRIGGFIREALPDASEDVILRKAQLAHAMLFFSRGVPVIYYGDEQGFASDGGDRGAREDMFETRTPDYLDNDLIGTDKTTADRNFDLHHPLFETIRSLSSLRARYPALRHGRQVTRYANHEKPVIVFSRLDPDKGGEILVGFNATQDSVTLNISPDARAMSWEALVNECETSSNAPGSYSVTIPPNGYIACRAVYFGETE